jgi:hypothetical protein
MIELKAFFSNDKYDYFILIDPFDSSLTSENNQLSNDK